jgi:two-component system response regulator AtoC
MKTVLIVEDETGLREGLVKAVESIGHGALQASGVSAARKILSEQEVGCVLLDIRLKDGDGLELLAELKRGELADVPVIMTTAYGDSERTIRAMRDGAFEYLTKPFDLPALLATLQRALAQKAVVAAEQSADPHAQRSGLVGSSAAMLAIWKLIGRAASTQAPVLITGETGTGKELVARAIHDYSALAAQPFVAVNLAALSPTLLESELFGHERGAFTGANARRSGRLELAGNGTLFLDEIGDLDASLQTKLLRVLSDGSYARVGSDETLSARARIVSATHKPVRPNQPGCVLREDLYYRLAVIEIEVPPLRARRSDLPLLVAHALRQTQARAVSEEAMQMLSRYGWPGNVRELIHVIQRAAALASGELIDTHDLPEALLSSSHGVEEEVPLMPLREAVAALERRMIVAALSRAQGNRSEAARQLGIGRPQLYAKMDEHGISRDGDDAP